MVRYEMGHCIELRELLFKRFFPLLIGDSGAGGKIPGGSVLVFTLELLKVSG